VVKLQVLGNNSKTVNNIKNLTRNTNDQHSKIYLPCNFEINTIWVKSRQKRNRNIIKLIEAKDNTDLYEDMYSKIYLPCNFEVNRNTHLGVIALFHQFV
jgi:hypothetical protein